MLTNLVTAPGVNVAAAQLPVLYERTPLHSVRVSSDGVPSPHGSDGGPEPPESKLENEFRSGPIRDGGVSLEKHGTVSTINELQNRNTRLVQNEHQGCTPEETLQIGSAVSEQEKSEKLSPRRIEALRKLASKNFTRFALSVQHMSEEAQLKIIQQLPEFRKLATDAIDSIDQSFQAMLDSNNESARNAHSAFNAYRDILKQRLERENITADEERWILNKIAETAEQQAKIHAEDREMKVKAFGKVVGGAVVVAITAIAVAASVNVALEQSDSDES